MTASVVLIKTVDIVDRTAFVRDISAYIVANLLVLLFLFNGHLAAWEAFLLLLLYAIYVAIACYTSKSASYPLPGYSSTCYQVLQCWHVHTWFHVAVYSTGTQWKVAHLAQFLAVIMLSHQLGLPCGVEVHGIIASTKKVTHHCSCQYSRTLVFLLFMERSQCHPALPHTSPADMVFDIVQPLGHHWLCFLSTTRKGCRRL